MAGFLSPVASVTVNSFLFPHLLIENAFGEGPAKTRQQLDFTADGGAGTGENFAGVKGISHGMFEDLDWDRIRKETPLSFQLSVESWRSRTGSATLEFHTELKGKLMADDPDTEVIFSGDFRR